MMSASEKKLSLPGLESSQSQMKQDRGFHGERIQGGKKEEPRKSLICLRQYKEINISVREAGYEVEMGPWRTATNKPMVVEMRTAGGGQNCVEEINRELPGTREVFFTVTGV